MVRPSFSHRWTRLAVVPFLTAAIGLGTAQAQQDRDQRRDDHNQQNNGDRNQQGRPSGQNDRPGQNGGPSQNGRPGQSGGPGQNGRPGGGNQGRPGNDFHFRDQDRGQLQSHYQSDVTRWRSHPQNRPQFARGQRIPNNYRFSPVPSSYYRGMPPPPLGYQYGYYDGYVVAYNPITRIIGDVLDLVAAASR